MILASAPGARSTRRAGAQHANGTLAPLMSPAIRDATSSRAAWLALVVAASSIGAATWLILAHRAGGAAGAAVAAAGVSLALGTVVASRSPSAVWLPRWRYIDAALDRAFDGAVLGAVAWTARTSDPSTCAGALAAIGGGFLAAYVRARGAALGYGVAEGRLTRSARYGLLAVGLATGRTSWAVWAIAAVSLAATLVRSSSVAKEERA